MKEAGKAFCWYKCHNCSTEYAMVDGVRNSSGCSNPNCHHPDVHIHSNVDGELPLSRDVTRKTFGPDGIPLRSAAHPSDGSAVDPSLLISKESIKEARTALLSMARQYVGYPWGAGGVTRQAHDAEVQILLELQSKVTMLRKQLEDFP